MKYVARYVEENENSPQTSEFTLAMKVLFQVALLGLAIYIILGLLVDFAVPFIPLSWEKQLAGPVMAAFQHLPDAADKYQIVKVQQLLDSLAEKMDGPPRQFSISILEKDEANALAFPGGQIIIYSKLLNDVGSENELAMVLAHELGHFAARDHLRGLGRSFLFFLVSTVMFSSDSGSSNMFMSSSGILQNNYSRSQEYAADQFALQLLQKQYGHVGGAVTFFERLAAKEVLPQLTHYMSTHPASENRVAALRKTIAARQFVEKDVLPVYWAGAGHHEAEKSQ